MFLYDRWAEERGWPPEVVRRLRRQELYWLPIIQQAKREAAEQIAKVEAAKQPKQ
jgi:hypothetical protein